MFYIKYFYFYFFIFYFNFNFYFYFFYFLFLFFLFFIFWNKIFLVGLIMIFFKKKLHRSIIRWTLFWQEKKKRLRFSGLKFFFPSVSFPQNIFICNHHFLFLYYFYFISFFLFLIYFYFISSFVYFYFFILIKYIIFYLQKKGSHHLNHLIPKNNQNKKNKPNHDSLFLFWDGGYSCENFFPLFWNEQAPTSLLSLQRKIFFIWMSILICKIFFISVLH